MKIDNLNLKTKIFFIPVAIMVFTFIITGIFLTRELIKKEHIEFLGGRADLMRSSLTLLSSTNLPAEALIELRGGIIGLQGPNHSIASEQIRKLKSLGIHRVYFYELDGTQKYTEDESVFEIPDSVFSDPLQEKGSVRILLLSPHMVGLSPIFDAETHIGYLVFAIEIPEAALVCAKHFFENHASPEGGTLSTSFQYQLGGEKSKSNVFHKRLFFTLMYIMLPCLVLIIFMLGSSSRYMLKEIHLILNAFNRLAEGELNQQLEVKSRDEIGQLCYFFNSMTDKLKNVIEGTILSMDELSHSIENVAASTGDASRSANEVADVSINTGTSVSETADAMKKIFNSVNESAEIVNALGEKSNEIGEITRVIDEIADQTNLLALNAAIEAARAGDQGRGFAVVADEVRKLAENTTKATKQIESYIRGIQEDTTTAVKIIKSGTAEVHTGLELSEHAGKSIEQAVGTIANISMLIEQIAAAAEEQSVTARELTLTIDAAFHTKKEKNAKPGYQTHAAHSDTSGKYRAG